MHACMHALIYSIYHRPYATSSLVRKVWPGPVMHWASIRNSRARACIWRWSQRLQTSSPKLFGVEFMHDLMMYYDQPTYIYINNIIHIIMLYHQSNEDWFANKWCDSGMRCSPCFSEFYSKAWADNESSLQRSFFSYCMSRFQRNTKARWDF